MPFEKILIVGLGTMTGAMLDGWIASGSPASRFEVYHPRRDDFPYGLTVYNEWPEAGFDAVLLGVKPYMLDDIAAGLEPLLGPETALLSVLAGVELSTYVSRFPRAGGIVRFMPNLASALGKSPNALIGVGSGGADLPASMRDAVSELAQEIGTAEWIERESQFDLVTALTGSGPGFVYRFISALAESASNLGLERGQANRLAVAMVDGASGLAAASPYSPDELARRVASPGGMTQKGLDVLDQDGALNHIIEQCLRAARDRGAEMAEAAREKG